MDGLHEYALRLGDDSLILGQRLGEWCGHGPMLEVDLSLTNIALDLVGQATLFLGVAGDADKLAFHRDVLDFKNCLLVEQPNGDFAQTIARQFLFSNWQELLFRDRDGQGGVQFQLSPERRADIEARVQELMRRFNGGQVIVRPRVRIQDGDAPPATARYRIGTAM